MLTSLGLKYPADASKKDLASLLNEAENTLGSDAFLKIVNSSQSLSTRTPSTRSLDPGTSILWTLINGVGGVTSETWDPPTPLEYGRTLT